MAYFTFDRKELDSLPAKDKKKALRACDLAEKASAYYQEWAQNYTETGHKDAISVKFTLREKFALAATSLFPHTHEHAAMTKLMVATQMNFYRENPQYLAVFPQLAEAGGKEEALAQLQAISDKTGPSYAPIDAYFDKAFADLKTAAATFKAPSAVTHKPPAL